jgi:hypothetical protein
MSRKFNRTLSLMTAIGSVTTFVAVCCANAFPTCASACAKTLTVTACYACCNTTTCSANEILNCQDACANKFPI